MRHHANVGLRARCGFGLAVLLAGCRYADIAWHVRNHDIYVTEADVAEILGGTDL
jgi:hypothetical protein